MKNEVIGLDYKKSNVNGSIPANVLKSICNTFISYLTKIINDSFETGHFPDEFKRNSNMQEKRSS